jgi:hypothetical protein
MSVFGILNTFSGSWEVEAREEPGTEPDAGVMATSASVSDFFLPFLNFLRVLRFFALVISLAFALCALGFWRRSVPGKRSAVHLESVIEFEVLHLLTRQGLSFEHLLKTDKSVVSVHTGAQSGGCQSSISDRLRSAHAEGRGVYGRTSEACEAC